MQPLIILASQSPRRRQLIDQLGLKYDVVPSDIEEKLPDSVKDTSAARQLAVEFARQKAFSVAQRMQKIGKSANPLVVIGADTVVALENKPYGKPNSDEEAREMLQALCGKTHMVYTGVALISLDYAQSNLQCLLESEASSVTFRSYSPAEIEAYIKTGEPSDKAGAYALQGIGGCLISKIEGCYTNVIGLPMPILLKMLRSAGVNVLGE